MPGFGNLSTRPQEGGHRDLREIKASFLPPTAPHPGSGPAKPRDLVLPTSITENDCPFYSAASAPAECQRGFYCQFRTLRPPPIFLQIPVCISFTLSWFSLAAQVQGPSLFPSPCAGIPADFYKLRGLVSLFLPASSPSLPCSIPPFLSPSAPFPD